MSGGQLDQQKSIYSIDIDFFSLRSFFCSDVHIGCAKTKVVRLITTVSCSMFEVLNPGRTNGLTDAIKLVVHWLFRCFLLFLAFFGNPAR